MPATTFLLLIATVLSVDGDVAKIDRGQLAGLRPGDVGSFYYQLTVDSEMTRIDVGLGTLIEAGDHHALIKIRNGAVRSNHFMEFKIPVPSAAGEQCLSRARGAPPRSGLTVHSVTDDQKDREPSQSEVEASVRDFVLAWAEAWSDQRVDDYLAFYARNFRPQEGIRRDVWEAQRRQRISGRGTIAVSVEQLKIVTVASKVAVATFKQAYRSETYRDRVSKLLDLIREDGEWRILEERLVEPSP